MIGSPFFVCGEGEVLRRKLEEKLCNVELHYPTQIIDEIGGNGIAVIYTFSDDGPTIAIKCELDALPINEKNQFSHRSTNDDTSHKCGHDGHLAIIAELIFWIKDYPFKTGKIFYYFSLQKRLVMGPKSI